MNRTRTAIAIMTLSAIALPAFARTEIDLSCMQKAIDKRETAIITAFDAYNFTTRSAMVNRKESLRNAWTIADKKTRREAEKNAEKFYRDVERTARKSRNTAEKQLKQTFRTESKVYEVKVS